MIASAFPTGLALGKAFINRTEERKHLSHRVNNNQHTVLMAPRRYGKTSLVVKVSEELGLPYSMVDLFSSDSEEEIRDLIAEKVGELVFQLSGNLEKLKKTVLNVFKIMKPELVLGAFGLKLQITFSKNPVDDISKLLLNLNQVAEQTGQKAVFFMDEFQQMSELKKCHKLEASIRHAVERSKNITYIFSGSNKHLLSKMFGDDSRPLYKLCHIMELGKILPEHYIPYLNTHAKIKWRKLFDDACLDCIFTLTDCHPFYMNMLCQLIWDQDKYPNTEIITEIWSRYVDTQRHFIEPTIASLSLNQRKILKALANSSSSETLSIEFLTPIKISTSSARQSLDYLQKKGLIQKLSVREYSILDAAIKYFLLKNH